jgi:predicted ribosome quality control (RQC) complex YloA/Tae2 family protein
LATANIYRIRQGDEFLEAPNYYGENEIIKIPLDPALSPAQNAQRYFKRYAKSKNAKLALGKQLALAENELAYLENVEYALKAARSEDELAEIDAELKEQGYVKNRGEKKGKKKKEKAQISQPLEFFTSDGFRVLVGKNNRQNDQLTLKSARGGDMWFHAQKIPGSHVVMKREPGREFSKTALAEAAVLAARHSKAGGAAKVPVDYTPVRNVKKPPGAKPGLVIYDRYETVYVNPILQGGAE